MEKYTTYCTEEQVRRAFKLSAPLNVKTIEGKSVEPGYAKLFEYGGEMDIAEIPTTQQMIGWLREEKGILVVLDGNSECAGLVKFKLYTSYYFKGDWKLYNGTKRIDNYKPNQAELAAIDAALDYLEDLKGK